jgi:glycine C-acetyltransferase
MVKEIQEELRRELEELRQSGWYKEERRLVSQQGRQVTVCYPEGATPRQVLNFCANNYLGLAAHAELIEAAVQALRQRGYGLSSVRFICGTQDMHKELEKRLAAFLGTEDCILYSSCFDANTGLFEPLLGPEDVVLSDELNHGSIIDGIRLCKARRVIYRHLDMKDLEQKLAEARGARRKLIATDGVFSMDGDVAPLGEICELADRYGALVMVDDSHATGFLGRHGRGSHEHCRVMGRVDIITTTLGKALGGASGGCTASSREIVDLLRQRSRPYLFSNTLPPPIVGAALKALELIARADDLRQRLWDNTRRLRQGLQEAGFTIKPGEHPIVPVLLYSAALAQRMARELYDAGLYVVGFFYPVVPRGMARIRVQVSAVHEPQDLDRAIEAFTVVGRKLDILGRSREEILARWGE